MKLDAGVQFSSRFLRFFCNPLHVPLAYIFCLLLFSLERSCANVFIMQLSYFLFLLFFAVNCLPIAIGVYFLKGDQLFIGRALFPPSRRFTISRHRIHFCMHKQIKLKKFNMWIQVPYGFWRLFSLTRSRALFFVDRRRRADAMVKPVSLRARANCIQVLGWRRAKHPSRQVVLAWWLVTCRRIRVGYPFVDSFSWVRLLFKFLLIYYEHFNTEQCYVWIPNSKQSI